MNRTALALLFTALSLSIPPAISSESAGQDALDSRPARAYSSIRIENFEQINQGILRGAAPGDEEIRELASHGVKTIVDLRMSGPAASREERLAKELHIEYLHVPLGFSKPSSRKLKQVLETLIDKQKQPVFVHCRQGADRTGMLIGIYRMLIEDWKFEAAYSEMRQHHFKPWLVGMKKTVQDCREIHELGNLHRIMVSSTSGTEFGDGAANANVAELNQ